MRVYEENIDEKGETVDKVKEARGHHTVKKRFTSFPSLAGMSTKLPLDRNNSVMTSLFPPRESLVVTSRLGTVNSRTFFFTVHVAEPWREQSLLCSEVTKGAAIASKHVSSLLRKETLRNNIDNTEIKKGNHGIKILVLDNCKRCYRLLYS
jgi:hypothetical protein